MGRGKVVAALRAAGQTVIAHDDLFAQDTPDIDWLARAGQHGWAVLSKDRRIRSRQNELTALMAAGVAAFVLSSADMTGDEMAAAWVAGLPKILRLLTKQARPFVARVTRSGDVEVVARSRR